MYRRFGEAWLALAEAASLAPISNSISFYILLDPQQKRFFDLCRRKQVFWPREQSNHLLHIGALPTEKMMWTLRSWKDLARWKGRLNSSAISVFFIALAIWDNKLYGVQKSRNRFAQYAVQTNKLSVVFNHSWLLCNSVLCAIPCIICNTRPYFRVWGCSNF